MSSDDDTPAGKLLHRRLTADEANELLRLAAPIPLTTEERLDELERQAVIDRIKLANLERLLKFFLERKQES